MHAKRVTFGITAIATVLALLVPTAAFAAPPTTVNADGGGNLIIDVTQNVVNDADSGFGGYWAYDAYTRHIQVWEVGEGEFTAVVTYDGTFTSWDGPSPNNTGTIEDGVTGTMVGGYATYEFEGDLLESPSWPTSGFVGAFDYACDHDGNCGPGRVSWLDQYFEDVEGFDFSWWGWTYTTCDGRFWVNADSGSYSDITGGPIACAGPAEPVARNFWGYINPSAEDVAARGNICYMFSKTQPTQSEEDNDVRRLCFTETSPNWWQGAVVLAHGDVYENGTDYGHWAGDAAARAFSSAKRLPLHAPAGETDLLDIVEMVPWTQ